MLNRNSPGRSSQQNNFMTMMHKTAFWLAVLATFLLWPQIWDISAWLTANVFRGQIEYAYLDVMSAALFCIIFMVLLSMARAGLVSSIFIAVLWLIARSPIL